MNHVSSNGRDGRYFRYYLWSNRWFARFTVALANGIQGVGRVLPARIRAQAESFAPLLRLLAQLIVQPSYIYKFMQWRPTLKGMLDGAVLGAILGFWFAYYLSDASALLNILILLLVLVVICMFSLLTSFLFVSGDVYFGRMDEFQKATSYQASATTLRVISFLLLLLFIGYVAEPLWRNAVYFHLSMLYFVGRTTYLFRLTQLRWTEMADVEVVQELAEDADVRMAREA